LRIRNRTGSVFNLLLRKSKFILFYVYSAAVLLLQPGELAKHAVSEGTKAVTNPATGAIFLSNPEESEGRRGGGGVGLWEGRRDGMMVELEGEIQGRGTACTW
jgi:hypothetical protein